MLTKWILCLLFLAPGAALDAAPQDGPELPHMQAIEEALKFAKSQDAEKREPAEVKIVESIDKLLIEYKNIPADRQKAAVATLGKVFQTKTPDDSNRIYIAAAAALSEMGPDGEAAILKAMKVQHLEKRIEVQATLIRALGKHHDEKQIDFLTKLLLKDNNEIVKAAIEALGEYRESDAKVRKKITEALVREYAKTYSADFLAKGKDEVWHDRLLAIEVPMNQSLEMLTLQRLQTAPEWEKWFNDNRNKPW
jgi:HEAT repeats